MGRTSGGSSGGAGYMPGVIANNSAIDNAPVINAAMAAVTNGGDTLPLPPGNIYLQTMLQDVQGVTLVGSGQQESNTQQGTYLLPNNTTYPITLANWSNNQSGMRNLTINGLQKVTYTLQVSGLANRFRQVTILGGTNTTLDTAKAGTSTVAAGSNGQVVNQTPCSITINTGSSLSKFNTAASASNPDFVYIQGQQVSYTSATSSTASGCTIASGSITLNGAASPGGDAVTYLVSTAGSLELLDFELNGGMATGKATNVCINWQGSDGLATHGRMINATKILGAGGTMLADIHYTAGSASVPSNLAVSNSSVVDQGGNQFVPGYFDSDPGIITGTFASASPSTITTSSNGTVTLNSGGINPPTGGGVITIPQGGAGSTGTPCTYTSASGLVLSGVNVQAGFSSITPSTNGACIISPPNGVIDRTQANVPSTFAGCRFYQHAGSGASSTGSVAGVPFITETTTSTAGAKITGGSLLIDGAGSSFNYFIKGTVATTKVEAVDIPTGYLTQGFTDVTPPLGNYTDVTINGVGVALGGATPGTNRPPPTRPLLGPANPAATASTSAVMAGMGSTFAYTPVSTGKLNIRIEGQANTATAAAQVTVRGYYGTGTAPSNGAAVTGSTFSAALNVKGGSAAAPSQFAAIGQVSGLTLGTAYWFDLSYLTASGSDAATLANVTCIVEECS